MQFDEHATQKKNLFSQAQLAVFDESFFHNRRHFDKHNP